MSTIPTIEPATVVAGDTISWQKSLSDYPATIWTLKYRLLNAAGKIDITATASGNDYLVSVASTTSASYAAGDYDWTAWVEKTGERVTVGSGRMTVQPNLAALNTYDGRSNARKIYEALQAAYYTAAQNRAFVQEYEIAGRRMKFTSRAEWLQEISYWKSQVASEDRAARIADGLGGNGRLMVRM